MRELEPFFKTVGEGLRAWPRVNAIADKLEGLTDVRDGQRSKPGTKHKPDREAKAKTPKSENNRRESKENYS